MINFPCDKCGLCCKSLHMSKEYDDLNRGDGICIHLDLESNLCLIYDERPEKCNVSKMYLHYKNILNEEEYINMNAEACKILKQRKGEF
ncbi:YkgJ family cysteine cluster protein [Macrococcoides canis]|uniref:YkgJ family cysteine cluster protein n=1 Tax=Macrococcoides canis TaxID=1855823 RepID=UPI00265F68BE|nr:YkgJ family cysteine cluster protein [Macrococcus canis]